MPQVIVVAIAWAASWITTAQFIFAVALAGYSTYAQSSARRKARNSYNDSLKDRLISVPVVDVARSRVYGRVRCADGIIYKATHGTNKENFTLVLALAGHEIDAVEQVYFNDVPVTLDGAGYVTTAPWLKTTTTSGRQSIAAGGTETVLPPDAILGSVGVSTEGSNGDRVAQQTIGFTLSGNTVTPDSLFAGVVRNVTYQVGNTASKARVRAFNGAPGQDLSTVLAGLPGITSAHRFAGIACLVIDLVYDQDAFPMGPPNVSAVVRGARLFDPRTSTTAWTENPALIARDWALYANGGGAALAELDATSFVAAANACDVPQSFTTVNAAGASSTQVLPLYTAGLVARSDEAPDEVMGEICSAMAGRWAWAGGRLRVRAGAYTAPVATLTEDWVSSAGEIDVVSTVPRTDLFNVVVPSIANRDQAYVVAPIPRIAPSEYITADGGEYPRDVTLTAVTDTAHAAHVCGVMLRDSRQALTVSLSCNLRALALELFDVIAVTLPRFGWAAKPFEVLGWGFSQEGGIKLTLKETDASIYNPDATFSRTDAAPNTALPNPYAVPGVSPSSITSGNAQLLRQADGTILSRIRVAWAAVQDEAVRNGGTIEVRYGPADSDPSTYQTEVVAGAETQALLTGVQDGRVYAISTRARNKLVAGAWSIQVLHVVLGKSAPPSNVTTLAATGAPGALRISWAPCPDADYALTELRVGTVWATATRIWRGTGSAFEWATAPGAYNILARHEDTTGNLSSAVVGVSATVQAFSAIRANLLPNGGFARGTAGWVLPSGRGFGVADSLWGRSLFSNTVPAGLQTFEVVSAPFPVQPGEWYVVHGDSLLFAAAGSRYFDLIFLDGSGNTLLDGPGGAVAAGSDFSADDSNRLVHAVEVQAPVGAVNAVARFVVEAANNITAVGCRAIKVERGRLPHTPYSDEQQAANVGAVADAAAAAATAAQTTANSASTNATNALARIAAIDSDGILSRGEKAATILDWQALQDEEAGIVAQANSYSIVTERDAYTSSKSALATYLSGLSPSWNDASQDTTIVPAVYRAAWADVYAKRQAVLNAISARAKVLADAAQGTANSAASAASAAQTTANTASTNATNALSTLATMRSNGFLDAAEKPSLIREWIGINGERAGIVAQANAYGIVTERNTYTAAHDALWAYLTSLSPAWDNTTADTPITPAVDQANWLALYNARQALLNKIAEVAGQRAVWASVNNRPANLAGLTGAEAVDNSLLSDSLIADPQFRSPDWWLGNWEGSGVTSFAVLNAVVWSDPGEANAPRFALQCSPATGDASGRRIVVERGGFYRLRIRIKRTGTAAGVFWAGIHLPGQSWWTPAPVVTSETPENGFNLAAIPADSWQTYTSTIQIATTTAQVQVRTRNYLTAGVVLFAVELVRVADWVDMIGGTGKPADNATRNDVYRQATDPGAVPNGSIWLNTTTGRALQRVAGAWQPYVGPASVDSGELAPGAAAVVSTSFLAGPVSEANDL